MAEHDDDRVKPSEQRGGTNPRDAEPRAEGGWGENAAGGLVPPQLGGSDAPDSPLHDDPEYSDAALGRTPGSDAPATQAGIDPAAGDSADAVADGGQKRPAGAEPAPQDAAPRPPPGAAAPPPQRPARRPPPRPSG